MCGGRRNLPGNVKNNIPKKYPSLTQAVLLFFVRLEALRNTSKTFSWKLSEHFIPCMKMRCGGLAGLVCCVSPPFAWVLAKSLSLLSYSANMHGLGSDPFRQHHVGSRTIYYGRSFTRGLLSGTATAYQHQSGNKPKFRLLVYICFFYTAAAYFSSASSTNSMLLESIGDMAPTVIQEYSSTQEAHN